MTAGVGSGRCDELSPKRLQRVRLPITHATAEHHGIDEVRSTLKRSNFVGS